MNISSIQEQILKLKKEKDVCILAHSYQAHEILEIADYTGDSYKLSVDASKAENKNILMCGVRFMAETCKSFHLKNCLPCTACCRLQYGRPDGQTAYFSG